MTSQAKYFLAAAIIAVAIPAWMFRYENYRDNRTGDLWHRDRFTGSVCPIDQYCFLYTFPDNNKPWHCIGNLTAWCTWNWGESEDREKITFKPDGIPRFKTSRDRQ
jgi:hypothetical protein